MFSSKFLLGLTLCLLVGVAVKAEENNSEPYFFNSGDKPMELKSWGKICGLKAKVDFAGPAELNGKKAYKIVLTLDGKGWCSYKLPLGVGVTMIPEKKYFFKAKYMVSKLPAGARVRLGVLICHYPDAKSLSDIGLPYFPLTVKYPGKEMRSLVSEELNARSVAFVTKRKIKAEKIVAKNLVIQFIGKFKNQKVELWLSDIAILPI